MDLGDYKEMPKVNDTWDLGFNDSRVHERYKDTDFILPSSEIIEE